MDRISVLVVDDHALVCEGLRALLERSPRLIVVGTAQSGAEAIDAAQRLKPDVVLMDLVLPALNGIDATERILGLLPRTRIILVTASQNTERVASALRAGATGYVSKQSASGELVKAILSVYEGKPYLMGIAGGLHAKGYLDARNRSPLERLSTREREVLQLTAEGATSVAIARHLSLSPKTVETYRSRIMKKLGVADRTALIHFAIEQSLTPL